VGEEECAEGVLAESGEEGEVNKKEVISLMTGQPCTLSEVSSLHDIEFSVDKSAPWSQALEVHMRGMNHHLSMDKRFYVTELVLAESDNDGLLAGGSFPKSAFTISFKAAQSLVDQLWACGVRPTEMALPQGGEIQATKDHLADMREIAFMYLGRKDES